MNKKFLSTLLIGLLCVNCSAVFSATKSKSTIKTTKSTTKTSEVYENDTKPMFKSWSTVKAYNTVNLVGEKLLEAGGINKNVVFTIVNKRTANASADIHNEVRVHTGLLKYVETEDELAAVLAHEIGHVANSDVKKAFGRAVAIGGIATAGAVLGGVSGGVASNAAVVGGTFAHAKMTKKAENRADLKAVDMLVKAGYNPLAIISILNKIATSHYGRSATHPTIAKRLKNIYEYINQNYPEYIEEGFPTVSYRMALKIINY